LAYCASSCWPWPVPEGGSVRPGSQARNYGSYQNPEYDALYERYSTTLEPSARDQATADLMKLLASDVPLVPIYFYGTGVIARRAVTGPGPISPLQTASAYNIESWEIH
jgi:peptide/nickel transport system substrate-binding protein